jgi:hypothetical protein
MEGFEQPSLNDLRKCYAISRVLLDISTPPFAHGHLYVALSRVTLYSDVHIICGDSQLFDEVPFATNTTYPELLDLHEEHLTENEDG